MKATNSTLLLIALTCFVIADTPITEEQPKKNTATDINNSDEDEKFINKFINEVIIRRELKMAGNYFSPESDYISYDRTVAIPEAMLKMNYLHERDLFLDDCEKILNMMPKVNPNQIRLVSILKIEDNNVASLKSANTYKGVFAYDDGVGRFEIVFPKITKFSDETRFATRFVDPFRIIR
jgi:hypothetical protein